MIRGPFLTDLDSRAAVKGSRDPLGHMAIWTHFGRHVVGNLTTVSTSLRDFTVLLLGVWFLERVTEQHGDYNEVEVFIRWEQLAAYARAKQNPSVSFRGVEQVRKRLSEGAKITVSAERGHQILGNQKIYGIWGLYTVAARSSGLLVGDPPRLTPIARSFVEANYIAPLSRDGFREGAAIVKLLAQPAANLQPDGKDAKLLQSLGKLLRADRLTAAERTFYDEHLVRGGTEDSTQGRQPRLAALLETTLADEDFELTPQAVGALATKAKGDAASELLRFRLDRIRHCEGLLAPTSRLFMFLLTRDAQTVASIDTEIRETWGSEPNDLDLGSTKELIPELSDAVGDTHAAERWLEIATRLSKGEYAEVIRLLIAHNAWVMQQRGSAAPWIELKGQRLHVRFRDELSALPKRKDLASLWRFPYFVDSLRSMTAQVRTA